MNGCLKKKKDGFSRVSRIHTMTLDEIPFVATAAKLKTIEVRLNIDSRKEIKVADVIEFQQKGNQGVIRMKVDAIRSYSSMAELIQNEDFLKTGGIYKSKEDWFLAIGGYYSIIEQNRFGLVVFELTPTDVN